MSILKSKFCVFCGETPESKNKEHVLPQWLLNLTGDPNRVVTLGFDYRLGKPVRFAWRSLVMPACESCNTEFASLESSVKPIIEKLLDRNAASVADYGLLLDWLDKVRVGLWLNYHILQGNPLGIVPSFHVKGRMRKKDRLLAVYPMGEVGEGLNAHGVESLAFHKEPSAFGLRINNINIVNCSSDYLISSRCGFPYPSKSKLYIDGEDAGKLELINFQATKKIKTPVFRFLLHKPSVYLLQPIVQVEVDMGDGAGTLQMNRDVVDYVRENTDASSGYKVGKIFRQWKASVTRLENIEELVEFDDIKGSDCATARSIVSQVYELQLYLRSLCNPIAISLEVRSEWELAERLIRKDGRARIKRIISE